MNKLIIEYADGKVFSVANEEGLVHPTIEVVLLLEQAKLMATFGMFVNAQCALEEGGFSGGQDAEESGTNPVPVHPEGYEPCGPPVEGGVYTVGTEHLDGSEGTP